MRKIIIGIRKGKRKKEGGFKVKALRRVEAKAGGIENSGHSHPTQSLKTLTLSPCSISHHCNYSFDWLWIRSSTVVELAD